MTDHDRFGEWAGAYALGALSLDERREFEAHLSTCAECARDVRDAALVAEGLGRAVDPQPLPDGLRARVLAAAIGGSRADSPARIPPMPVAPPRPVVAQWLAVAASVAALALGLYAWTLQTRVKELDAALAAARGQLVSLQGQVADLRRVSDETTRASDVLAASDVVRFDLAGQKDAPQASGRAFWSPSQGLVISASRLPSLPPGRIYQLWVLTASGPVSAGLTRPDAAGRLHSVTSPTTALPATGVGVSLELEGGVAAPTAIYLVGTL
jgi:anti-sigma-K factor RskA